MALPLDRADRDVVLLALAILSLDRPGWADYLSRVAAGVDPDCGTKTFEEFARLNRDRFQAPRPLV